jgi:hypothetical protein
MKKKPEQILREQVSQYLKYQYPNAEYKFDLESDMPLTIPQAVRNKKLQNGRGWPDLFIAEPTKDFNGLFIELKASNIYRKDGLLKTSPHLKEQDDRLWSLLKKGYKAVFAVGFDHAKRIIDEYMGLA